MNRLRKFLAAALALFGISCGWGAKPSAVVPDEHKALSIYQIMVASFQHSPEGAPGYSAMWGPDGHTKNGNLRGITEALDTIAALGVNAIWLTPVFDSSQALGGEKLQATGYFTNDYFRIDPHFGTDSEFRELVDSAHARGLYVILDGVFGHHGGVKSPSPSGAVLDTVWTESDRPDGGLGNVRYPASLDYIKDVATYYIREYGIDGWRLDQAYQAMQGGHNYWLEIREAVEQAAHERRENGEHWGTLAYMVGEDWGDAARINQGVYSQGGLLSAFDFDGKERISGEMQSLASEGLENSWHDVEIVLSSPSRRGYLNDSVAPNLFLSNHDGYRLADHFDPADPHYYGKIKTRFAILAAYSGPITLYYGDEYADRSAETEGGQKDNIARTSGHLEPRNAQERDLRDYVARAMRFRAENPAMYRGTPDFTRILNGSADAELVVKTDPVTGSRVAIVFSDGDTRVTLPDGRNIDVKAWTPEFVVLEY